MEGRRIVRVAFQQADGKVKLRPAVVLKKLAPYEDLLVCAISSITHLFIPDLDLVIDKDHAEFGSMGLGFPALIRSSFLTTVSISAIQDPIGSISADTLEQLLSNLAKYLSPR